ncbi:hypothetical protein NL676_014249 [Syzygium grande]|nr:hypothetical protein NL676_014249 [Syzygium grande]
MSVERAPDRLNHAGHLFSQSRVSPTLRKFYWIYWKTFLASRAGRMMFLIIRRPKVEDQESVERSDRRRSDDFVTGEISGISQASEARRSSQLPENNLGHDGDQRTTMVHDQEWMARSPGQRRDDVVFTIDRTYTSLREWPLLGYNHGPEDRRAAIHDRDSMQRSHGWRSHCDVVALGGTAGGSRHTEWAQLLDYLIQQGEGKKEAKTKKKER